MIGRPGGPGGSLLRLKRLREAAKNMTKTKSATSTGNMMTGRVEGWKGLEGYTRFRAARSSYAVGPLPNPNPLIQAYVVLYHLFCFVGPTGYRLCLMVY